MSQFHLHLGIGCLGALGEDFQDQAGPVDDVAALDDLFDVALLGAGEFVIENDILDLILFAVFLDLFELSRADVGGLVRPVHPLQEHLVADGSGGLRQELELVQVLLHLALPSLFEDHAHEYRFLCFVLAHSFFKRANSVNTACLSYKFSQYLDYLQDSVSVCFCSVHERSFRPVFCARVYRKLVKYDCLLEERTDNRASIVSFVRTTQANIAVWHVEPFHRNSFVH